MQGVSTKARWTDEELTGLPKDGRKYELIEGRLMMSPASANHGSICIRLAVLLATHVQRRKLGVVYDSSTGFRLSDEVVLSPDLAFVSRQRLSRILVAPDKFLAGAPDLVVEVISPTDRLKDIQLKLDQYFDHGTKLAWLVDWRKQTVTVHSADSVITLSRPHTVLTGGSVLSGFRCKLSRIFAAA